MHRKPYLTVVGLLALVLCPRGGCQQAQQSPQSKRTLPAVKAAAPPTVDGDLSDPVWETAAKAETFWDNQTGRKAEDPTTVYVLYDESALYFGFRCVDSQPDKIVARETVRDQKYNGGSSEDDVEVLLDPFLTRRGDDYARFSVNPLGTPSARVTGGRADALEWKGDWSAAAKRVTDGWTAEMRIPWTILSYPSSSQPINMGLNFWRHQERLKTEFAWSYLGPQYFQENHGTWTGVIVPKNAFKPTLSLLPYVIPGFVSSRASHRSGLDVKYTVTPQLTAVSTINPDFGTIEGAVEGINFSRSERFVPERRPFFQEGRDYFEAGDGFAVGDYFYSGRIKTFDWGTKLYGKIGPRDTLGFLHTIDFGRRSDIVARLRHDFSETAGAGLFFTQMSAADDNNTVLVADQYNRWGSVGLSGQIAISSGHSAGGSAKQINLTHSTGFFFSSLQYLDVGRSFRDANGLIGFTDYRGFHLYNEYNRDFRKGFVRFVHLDLYGSYDWRQDGRFFRNDIGASLWLATRSDWGIDAGWSRGNFEGARDATWGLGVSFGVSNRFRKWNFGFRRGTLGDRSFSFLGPGFSVRVLKRLDISYGGAIQNLGGQEQQHILTLNYEISPTRAIGGRAVIHQGRANWYLSYKRAGALGNQYYLMLGDPNAERFVKRLLMKVVFPM